MTLSINAFKTIGEPSPDDIREATFSLDASGDAFLVLGPTDLTYVQCSGDPTILFDLEYQEGFIDRHYRAVHDGLTAEEIVRIFSAYARQDPNWDDGITWEHITW